MNTLEKYSILQQRQATTAEALQFFDELDPMDTEFMLGRWQGSSFCTGHRLDGLLEAIGWYGKEFISLDKVHPLLFADGGKIFKVDPNPIAFKLGFNLPIPKNPDFKPFYLQASKLLQTEDTKARLRMMEYRGKTSAVMVYDYLPINDIFRQIDSNTVLGLMDYKEMNQPFFFILNRVSTI